MSRSDQLYSKPRRYLVDFAFDQSVADVFPDMIRRSIPGYDQLIALIGLIAARYYQPERRIYDLGCSLGAATLSIHRGLDAAEAEFIAVDNSPPMLARCRDNLSTLMPGAQVNFIESDIRQLDIRRAGVVVLNFTLQFLPPEDRQSMLDLVFAGLEPGGVLILSVKIGTGGESTPDTLVDLHARFKAANGYSELEISQNRSALEKEMRLDPVDVHRQRLERSGFSEIRLWFQCLNFVSLLAVK